MSKDTRAISWIKAAHKEFGKFPQGAQTIILRALTIAAESSKADIAKPMKGLGSGVIEVLLLIGLMPIERCMPLHWARISGLSMHSRKNPPGVSRHRRKKSI